MTTTYRTNNHSVFSLHAHLVFVTKYRHKVFTATHLDRLQAIIATTGAPSGVNLSEFNGEADHVHLLIDYPPDQSISAIAGRLKGVSSRNMRLEYPELERHYRRAKQLWSNSYFAASAGGAPLSVLRQYIEGQQRPS